MADPPAEHDAAQEPVTRPDHHGSGVGIDQPIIDADKKKRRRKKLLRRVIVILSLIVLLVALAPTLLSTGPGTRLLVSFINKQTPGEVTVDDLQLSWFGGQRVDGLIYKDAEQGLSVQSEFVVADNISLFDLLRGDRRFGDIQLGDTEVVYTVGAKAEVTPSKQPVDPLQSTEPIKLPAGLTGNLIFDQLTVKVLAEDAEPIVLASSKNLFRVDDIRDINFFFYPTLKQGDKEGFVEITGSFLNLFDPDGVIQIHQADYHFGFKVEGISTTTLGKMITDLHGGIEPGRIEKLVGKGEAFGVLSINGPLAKLRSILEIDTPKLQIKLDQITENGVPASTPTYTARLALDQAGFEALFPHSGLTLHKPTAIAVESLEMALPILDQAVDWDAATASLILKASDNLAVVDKRGEVLGINDLKIIGSSDSIADKLTFKLTTELSAVTRDSEVSSKPVVVDLIIREPMASTRQIDFFSEALPIQLADALAGQDGKLVLWLGEMLALQADVKGTAIADGKGSLQIEQQFSLRPEGRVNGTVSGTYRQGRFTLATPKNEPVEATLTPEAFASLMEMLSGRPGEPALTIDKDMPVYLTLRDPNHGAVSITTRSDKAGLKRFYPDPDQTYLAATIELSPARVLDPKLKKTYELRGGTLSLSVPDLRGKTKVRAELDLWVRPDAGSEGVASLLMWETTVTDLLDSEGSVPLDSKVLMQQLAASGDMKLTNAPSGLMDSLLNRQGDLASILGPIVQNMDAGFTYKDGQPTGATVRLNWDDASNQPIAGSWASMKPAAFDIDAKQMLTVRGGGDLELEVRVSEDFGDRWMGKLHPILFDAKSGDRPVKVKIDGKSFRFPLQGEALQGARVEASVDLGTIEFGNDALLGKLMQWTNRPGERAVFEPATVSLVDGKISYDQFDLAVGKVKLRLDGEVDLTSGRIVDMAVRVPGDSLIRVFNELDGVIKPDDYLSIPMTGEIRKPTFDSKLIGREVARLVTRGLIDKQKDDLKDLIRDGVGGDDKPEGEGGQVPKSVEDELIDSALDLLFKRLGKDKD